LDFRYNRNLIAQFSYLIIIIETIINIYKNIFQIKFKSKLTRLNNLFFLLATDWMLFNCLIQPTHNLIVIALWNLIAFMLKSLLHISVNKIIINSPHHHILSFDQAIFLYHIISKSCYFSQGNSNSLTTIQISSGFVGINQVNEPIIALLLLCNTYSSNIYWFLIFVEHFTLSMIQNEKFLIKTEKIISISYVM
jgi:hypothetical protein